MDTQETEHFQHKIKVESDEPLRDYENISGNEPAMPNIAKTSSDFDEKPVQDAYFDSQSALWEKIDIRVGNQVEVQSTLEGAEQNFVKPELVFLEELGIKIEDEERGRPTTESERDQAEKLHNSSNKTDSLNSVNQISTNSSDLHLSIPPVSKCFKCIKCSFQTRIKQTIIHHVREHIEMPFKCSHCPYKARTKYRLKYHQLKYHQLPATWYRCTECRYKTKLRETWHLHIATSLHCPPLEPISSQNAADSGPLR